MFTQTFTQWAWYRAVTRIRLIVTFVSPPLFVPPKFYYCRLLTRSKFVMTSYLLFVNCGLRDQTKLVVVFVTTFVKFLSN